MITQRMKVTHGKLEGLSNAHEEIKKMNEAAIKNLEVQMGQTSTQLANLTRPEFYGTTLDNPRNETFKMMEGVNEGATTKKGLKEADSLKDEIKARRKKNCIKDFYLGEVIRDLRSSANICHCQFLRRSED